MRNLTGNHIWCCNNKQRGSGSEIPHNCSLVSPKPLSEVWGTATKHPYGPYRSFTALLSGTHSLFLQSYSHLQPLEGQIMFKAKNNLPINVQKWFTIHEGSYNVRRKVNFNISLICTAGKGFSGSVSGETRNRFTVETKQPLTIRQKGRRSGALRVYFYVFILLTFAVLYVHVCTDCMGRCMLQYVFFFEYMHVCMHKNA